MWESSGKTCWTALQEIYSAAEVRTNFPDGTRLRALYRSKDLGDHSYQATVVWRDGSCPKLYRTQDNLDDLQRIASNVKDNKNSTASLFSKTRDAVVHEYISHETGLIRNEAVFKPFLPSIDF